MKVLHTVECCGFSFHVCEDGFLVDLRDGNTKGTLDKDSMMNKLDVFLLNGRISEEEYSGLVLIMNKEEF